MSSVMLWVALGWGILIVLTVIAVKNSPAADSRVLQAIAREFGGTVTRPDGWTAQIDLKIDGVPATVAINSEAGDSMPCTLMHVAWGPAKGNFSVAPENFAGGVRKLFGAQDIETWDRTFNDAFLVQGSPVDWVRDTLDSDVRRGIERLAEIHARRNHRGGVTMNAGRFGISFRVDSDLSGHEEDLRLFMNSCLAIVRKMRAGGATPEPVLTGEFASRSGLCAVCGVAPDATRRECPRCRAPYHDACWTWLGGCAIYGCRGR